jgi:threonine/homoserine/homoserine lactone efflux protein
MLELVTAMCIFSLTMSMSPGPVNMTIIASGVQHGVRQTMGFVNGAALGFTALLVLVGFALDGLASTWPRTFQAMELAGAAFILHTAWCIMRAGATGGAADAGARPPGFLQGWMLQWLNPKAWIAGVAGVAMFASPDSATPLLVFIVLYTLICYLSFVTWAMLGERAQSLLDTPSRMRAFNLAMGGSLALTALYLMAGALAKAW